MEVGTLLLSSDKNSVVTDKVLEFVSAIFYFFTKW